MQTFILGILEEGFAYAILALGVYITYKILDFPDLSVDGTFPLGGALTAILITAGVNPLLALLLSFMIGAVAGIVTGIIHVKFKVRDLLSGIIVMTGLYSINLRVAGSANVPIFMKDSIFENRFTERLIPDRFNPYLVVTILFLIVVIMKVLLDLYLGTKSGYLLRAVGDNETVVTSLAKDKGVMKIIGLSIANAFVAVSGSIFAQKNGYFDISIGTGAIVTGVASVIIGINTFQRFSKVKATTAVIIGSVLYKACVAVAINLGLKAQDQKLITSVLFLIILITSNEKKRRAKNHAQAD
ncbi:putative ABC transport system permease protein [Herbinix hemicellulosilytica]|uniref:Putative membrane protein n=1 Tax=Herbinix hemicellulosilytica TaxID=1564487 RepID=A0A0H5SJ06_HERHM|nr:ABC transporter permease [Herbinix hemicellulosilytica]RBP57182.1 putative ABC transport system permease protein [Herbinix hemicellulosilytica]CRZ35492.1 putative membrane protein [Herbinix hemicellulosilytica]